MSLPLNNITRFVFAIFLIWVLELSGIVQAENHMDTKTVVVISTGKIIRENTARAREDAIANSLVSAIDKVAVELLPPESLIENFQKLNEALYGQTSQFIRDYKVLAEFLIENNYRVMVEASVSISSLKELLSNAGIVLDRQALPRILLLVSEQNLEDSIPRYWWGKDSTYTETFSLSALAENMIVKGFPVIDSNIVPQKTPAEDVYDKPNLNNREAVDLGLHLQAEVVIVGESVANKMPNVMGESIRTFKGTVTVRAIRTDTGAEIATTMQTSVKTNSDEFIGNRDTLFAAGALAGQEIASQIVTAWQKEGKPPNMVEIKVEGAGNLANFVEFRRIVRNIPGVKDLQMKEMTSNEATMIVVFQGSAKELANALLLETFESIGINIYEVSQNHLRIALIPG
jgi:hypothetical protein